MNSPTLGSSETQRIPKEIWYHLLAIVRVSYVTNGTLRDAQDAHTHTLNARAPHVQVRMSGCLSSLPTTMENTNEKVQLQMQAKPPSTNKTGIRLRSHTHTREHMQQINKT